VLTADAVHLTGAPETFDEAFAIYAGNPTCAPYNLAQKYAPIFGSIKDCATNSSYVCRLAQLFCAQH
jgi:hypothetical protein